MAQNKNPTEELDKLREENKRLKKDLKTANDTIKAANDMWEKMGEERVYKSTPSAPSGHFLVKNRSGWVRRKRYGG